VVLHGLKSRLLASAGAVAGSVAVAGEAFAQAAAPVGGIGAQMNLMSSEAISAGGTGLGMAMYVAALICFVGGAWYLWQSRQPENRETGKVAAGLAGLVMAGLFATGPTWIGKASVTTSGGQAAVTNTPTVITFGAAGGGG